MDDALRKNALSVSSVPFAVHVHVRVDAPGYVELRRLSLGQTLNKCDVYFFVIVHMDRGAHKPSVHGACRRVAATSIYTHHLVLPPASTK